MAKSEELRAAQARLDAYLKRQPKEISEKDKAEGSTLRRFTGWLKRRLRKACPKGPLPPQLKRVKRSLRKEAVETGRRTGSWGPRNPDLVTEIIHAVLLVCYQYDMCRDDGYKLVSKLGVGTAYTVRNTFLRYATDEEIAYTQNRKRKGKTRTRGWNSIQAALKARDLGVTPQGEPNVLERYMFQCLKVPTHPDWETMLANVLHSKTGCRKCAWTLVGLNARGTKRPRKTKA